MEEPMYEFIKNIKLAKLMFRLIETPGGKIQPVIDPSSSMGYRYGIADEYLGKDSKMMLDKLTEKGLLDTEFFSKELGCPKDFSINIVYKRKCPHCQSTNISKHELIEHVECGYIGPDFSYKDHKCPKCEQGLEKIGVDYVKQGLQYACLSCDNFFQNPVNMGVCMQDKYAFPIEDAKEVDLYSYEITKRLKEEITKAINQQQYIGDRLKELGFKIQSPAMVKGRSGINHDFFMVATTGAGFLKTTILIEILGDGEITKDDVFNLYARATDVSAFGVLFGAIPRMTDEAKAVADSYKMAYIEAEDLASAAEKMVRQFAQLIETPEERMLEIFGGLGEKKGAA